ncbi:MAG: hypothetical protein II921_01415 [Treponema sp.]|nr:hypothetical protein [Treponema sp.]
MCNFGIVESVGSKKGEAVVVKPYLSDSCMGCQNKCGRFGKPIEALNPHQFPLREKQTVRLRVSRIQFFVQGFFSLFFPIVCSFASLFAAPKLVALLFKTDFASRHFQALEFLMVLATFLLSSALVFFLSRTDFVISRPEIEDIIIDG